MPTCDINIKLLIQSIEWTYRSDRKKRSGGIGASGGQVVGLRGGLSQRQFLILNCTCLQLTDDTRAEIPVVADDLDELSVALLASAVCIDEDGQGLSNTNGVRELDKGTTGKASSDQRLGDPSSGVSGRTINLGEVLS